MFPPKGDQAWNSHLDWQPVPVHSVPAKDDYLLADPLPACPAYEEATKQLLETPKFKKMNADAQPLYRYLTENTGFAVNSFSTAFTVMDTLFVEATHHKV